MSVRVILEQYNYILLWIFIFEYKCKRKNVVPGEAVMGNIFVCPFYSFIFIFFFFSLKYNFNDGVAWKTEDASSSWREGGGVVKTFKRNRATRYSRRVVVWVQCARGTSRDAFLFSLRFFFIFLLCLFVCFLRRSFRRTRTNDCCLPQSIRRRGPHVEERAEDNRFAESPVQPYAIKILHSVIYTVAQK